MNRYVALPGLLIGALFLTVAATPYLGRGTAAEDALPGAKSAAPFRLGDTDDTNKPAATATADTNPGDTPGLESVIAREEKAIRSLAEAYVRPWREYSQSPQRLLSRAGPRPVPPITTEITMFPDATGPSDGYRLGSIAVRYRNTTEIFPCLVDATSLRVRIFSNKHWISEKDWLAMAPLP